jgi:hypothetical protein
VQSWHRGELSIFAKLLYYCHGSSRIWISLPSPNWQEEFGSVPSLIVLLLLVSHVISPGIPGHRTHQAYVPKHLPSWVISKTKRPLGIGIRELSPHYIPVKPIWMDIPALVAISDTLQIIGSRFYKVVQTIWYRVELIYHYLRYLFLLVEFLVVFRHETGMRTNSRLEERMSSPKCPLENLRKQ